MAISGSLQTWCQDVHDRIADVTGDSTKAQFPYFAYGDKAFKRKNNRYPQIRWHKIDQPWRAGTVSQKPEVIQLYNPHIIQQTVLCQIWAETELEVLTELGRLAEAIDHVSCETSNSLGLRQFKFEMNGLEGTWEPQSQIATEAGEKSYFTYDVLIPLPTSQKYAYTTIVSASFTVSASQPTTGTSPVISSSFTNISTSW